MDDREPVSPADAALLAELRRIINAAPSARSRPLAETLVPCLFTMPLDDNPERVERCRIDAGTPHRIHVSAHGVYRWNDDGHLIPTPHIASPAFQQLYHDDPTGQTPWTPPAAPDGGVALHDPSERPRGFKALAAHWNTYAHLPALQRRLRRAFLLVGFTLGLIVTIAAIAAVILAILVLAWFMVAYFARWLTT